MSWLLLLSFILLHNTSTGLKNAEIVYPERIHHSRSRRDLSTALQNKRHEDSFSVKIGTKKGDMILDLQKHDKIFPRTVLLRTYDAKGKPKHDQIEPDNCHFHGKVRHQVDSEVYLTTCHGLTGTILSKDGRYDIEPHDAQGAHKYYRVDEEVEDISNRLSKKSYADTPTDVKNEIPSAPGNFKPGHAITTGHEASNSMRNFELINVEEQYIPYLTTNHTRYVEMFISADHKIYHRYNNDTQLVLERILNAVGQVDKSYSAINIRLVVVSVEVQTNGPAFSRSKNGGTDLHNFKTHFNKLRGEDAFKDIRIDNGQLFSNDIWSRSVAGMAWLGGMCSGNSNGINGWSYSISGPTMVLGHEFGHNMNFPHDWEVKGTQCKCLTRRGCFMGGKYSSRPGFSDCSLKHLALKPFTCINDYPMNPLISKCGNGIKELGEECDCGTPEMCEKNDPCCKPFDCKLKDAAQCNFINNPSCCNKQCQFKKQGTMCREPASNCDTPEYCTGDVATCPEDRVRADGTPCGESKKLVLGTYRKRREMRELTPRINAQYVKIIPKYWVKDGRACMSIEMLGCDTIEDSSSVPTSISTPHDTSPLCFLPDITSCENVPDDTPLMYRKAVKNDCNHPHMMFVYEADGTLVHQCSGKKVCRGKGYLLRISNKCDPDDSKFERTLGWSLKHKRTGYCVVSPDDRPSDGDRAKLRKTCDAKEDTTKLMMRNIDCRLPVGFENGKLPTSSFSAGQTYRKKTLDDIRLGRDDVWCPASKTNGSWFRINLGKKVELRYITMAGEYWNWVTGYYIMYSDDGIKWKYYKETGGKNTKIENSVCYKGSCGLAYDHQCQQLWSAGTKSASKKCWDNLNTGTDGFGTCDPTKIKACPPSDVYCGQLQCSSPEKNPYYVNYGANYAAKVIDGGKCSTAKIVGVKDELGLGMVADGTKCDDGKICVGQMCKTPVEHGGKICPSINGKICDGRGYCLDDGTCFCENGYDPATNCATMTDPVDGKWSAWSAWSNCTKACGSGKHKRHRFCDSPSPKHGGKACTGNRVQESECNGEPCIVGRTCKDIKLKMESAGKQVLDGVYKIKPTENFVLDVWCDMTRDGGGWTLIVSSHTNTWSEENVWLRNVKSPALYEDYSIFKYGNKIMDDFHIDGEKFQYRLEANSFGKWGGIWEAPMAYDVASTNPNQVDVKLLKKFSDWNYVGNGITRRIPYIEKQRIKVGKPGSSWGSMTDNVWGVHPSKWISGKMMMAEPEHVWYWLREGDYINPKSCLELMFRGFDRRFTLSSGIYEIEPIAGKVVKTYCDLDRHGGGWTLLTKTSGSGGWNQYNVLNRNWNDDAINEYSIFGLYETLQGNDVGEASFNYMIEADGNDRNGGIFTMQKGNNINCPNCELKPTLVKKFGNWNENIENIAKFPLKANYGQALLGAEEKIMSDFVTANVKRKVEVSGVLISSGGNGIYMTSYMNPKSIKVWIREGGSRKSCNDLRIHGYHKGKNDYKDGFYMMKDSQPMYCDMTTTPKEGWTLLVTAASKGWSKEQVKLRNKTRPSIYNDYSILGQADSIKLMSEASHFKYMLSAQKKRHWGGIWKAPIEYSFVFTSNDYKDVELIKEFDLWDYDKQWYKGPCKRMPYLETSPKKNNALLTTAYYSDYWEWGSIVSNQSDESPSKWIYPQLKSPGHIWYWLDESDCDANYTKVDGGYSVSTWSSCSVFCGGEGDQVRKRVCNDPKPSCGGDPCDASLKLVEKRPCNVPCKTTKIFTLDNNYCFEPAEGGCSPTDGTYVTLRPTTSHCQGKESLFVFNPNKGTLLHSCSKKQVCFKSLQMKTNLVIDSNCPEATDKAHIQYTIFNSLHIGPLSFRVQSGFGNGVNIILWTHNIADVQYKFKFSNGMLKSGPVKWLLWKDADSKFFSSDKRFPSAPSYSGFIYNLETPENIADKYAMQLSSYFLPPETGDYIFKASCDDKCQVYLSSSSDEGEKKQIIKINVWTPRYQWDKRSTQSSEKIRLSVGKPYYIEARMFERDGGDHMEIGVVLPDGKFVAPITSEYLARSVG